MSQLPLHNMNDRNHGIDVLRGISILLVILSHLGMRIPLGKSSIGSFLSPRSIDVLVGRGYDAVFIFFVISGFLITSYSFRRWQSLEKISLRSFYARRVARIAPLLIVLVILLSILDLLGAPGYVIHRADQSLTGAAWAALTLHLNWYEAHTGYLPPNWDVLWSLSIEETFYLGFPLLCLLTRRLWVLVPMLLLLAFSLPFSREALAHNELWMQKAYLPGMAAIAMGVFGAIIANIFTLKSRVVIRSLLILGSLGFLTIFVAEDELWPYLGQSELLVQTFSVLLIVVALHWNQISGRNSPLPGLGWLRSCGRNSYEVYLTHAFVVLCAVGLFRAVGEHFKTGYLWYLPVLILCWALGAFVSRYFSVPMNNKLRALLISPASDNKRVT